MSKKKQNETEIETSETEVRQKTEMEEVKQK